MTDDKKNPLESLLGVKIVQSGGRSYIVADEQGRKAIDDLVSESAQLREAERRAAKPQKEEPKPRDWWDDPENDRVQHVERFQYHDKRDEQQVAQPPSPSYQPGRPAPVPEAKESPMRFYRKDRDNGPDFER